MLKQTPGAVLARITGARKGVIVDGLLDDDACDRAARADRRAQRRHADTARQRAADSSSARRSLADVADRRRASGREAAATRATASRSSTIGYVLKLFRRIEPAPNPEFEIGRVPDRTRVHAHAGARSARSSTSAPGSSPARSPSCRQPSSIRDPAGTSRIDELAPLLRAASRRDRSRRGAEARSSRDARDGLDAPERTAAVLRQPRALVSADARRRSDAGPASCTSRWPTPAIRRSRRNRWIAPRSMRVADEMRDARRGGARSARRSGFDAGRAVPRRTPTPCSPPRRDLLGRFDARARARRRPAGASGFTATTTSVRSCGRRKTSSFSTSRASRRGRSPNGAPSSRR